MAFGLPKTGDLFKLGSKKLLIASSAITCLAVGIVYVSISNKNVDNYANNNFSDLDNIIDNAEETSTNKKDKAQNWENIGVEKKKETKEEENTKKISVLKPYPNEIQTASKDLADLRNPFAPPAALGSTQGIAAPLITIKGFATSKFDPNPRAFLSINNSEDNEYQIGQDIGKGYRIVEIDPETQKVIVSDGINRYDYILKEF